MLAVNPIRKPFGSEQTASNASVRTDGIATRIVVARPTVLRDARLDRTDVKSDDVPMSLAKAHLRVARPTDQLAAVVKFYCEGLGLEVLYEFQDHDGFDGVMLGHKTAGYHLEFTRKRGHTAGKAPTRDNLLVFYIPVRTEWEQAAQRLEKLGYPAVQSFNPYWIYKERRLKIPTATE